MALLAAAAAVETFAHNDGNIRSSYRMGIHVSVGLCSPIQHLSS